MLLPRIWDEDLFENMDNWMSWPDESEFFGKKNPLYGKHAKNLMKTDVRETEDAYEVDIDLPGFKKDEVTITVENGYLNISAVKGLDKDETDKKTGKYKFEGIPEGQYFLVILDSYGRDAAQNLTELDDKQQLQKKLPNWDAFELFNVGPRSCLVQMVTVKRGETVNIKPGTIG